MGIFGDNLTIRIDAAQTERDFIVFSRLRYNGVNNIDDSIIL